MMRFHTLAVLLALTLLGSPLAQTPAALAQAVKSTVPTDRLTRLGRGVNLAHWLWLYQGKPEDREAYFTEVDARQLRTIGLTHVRLPIDPGLVFDRDNRSVRDPGLANVRRAVDLITRADLAVVVEIHAADPWLKPDDQQRLLLLESLWEALAASLADTDPGLVILEICNEPHDMPLGAWAAAQAHLARVIRAKAPRHTIMATGDSWGSIEGLTSITPLDDPNVVYSFHFYEPHNFTHQGASWGFAAWKHFRDLPWPATSADLTAAADKIDDEQARSALRWSAKEPWSAQFIRTRIDAAAAWSKRHGVPIYCGEFGVYKAVSPPDARLRWLKDTTEALAAQGIGWSIWDYSGGFALLPGKPGARSIDADIARTIGLPDRASIPANP
jgi:endoglucanase